MPDFVHITETRMHDRKAAHLLKLVPGSIVAFDRGYNNYGLFAQLTRDGAYFVIRLKENVQFEIVEERPLPKRRSILPDQIINWTGHKAKEKCAYKLRKVVVWDRD